MWIQVRTMDGKKSSRIDGLSKLTKIEDLRKLLVDTFDAPVDRQRLFFRGKQLEDGHSLFDYNVGLNEIVQIIVKPVDVIEPKKTSNSTEKVDKENKCETLRTPNEAPSHEKNNSKYFKYPEGYLESLEEKSSEDKTEKKRKKGLKDDGTPQSKKKKSAHTVPSDVLKCIEDDTLNKKLWDECLEVVTEGSQIFLKKVEDIFSCICCQEVVFNPITTKCFHNICKPCLERSFKAEVYNCPMCRQELEKSSVHQINSFLQKTLISLFPGYDAGR